MIIKNVEINRSQITDVRIDGSVISAIGSLKPQPNERVVNGNGNALIPGLNDHHIHFLGFAASLSSVNCGPDAMHDAGHLAATLRQKDSAGEWIRGYGYHDSVAGDIDRAWLDQFCQSSPVRIQHRSGRLWILNSVAIEMLRKNLKNVSSGIRETLKDGFHTGQFYDADKVLGAILGRTLPPVFLASKTLASYGITGFCDMTPSNDQEQYDLFCRLHNENTLLQTVLMAGSPNLTLQTDTKLATGPTKIHLHETQLPSLENFIDLIRASHQAGRTVAIHCVTEVELLFTLAAFDEAGTLTGDRLEHASITPEAQLQHIHDLGLTVVTQPHFIAERGDAYLRDIPLAEHENLYRCKTLLNKQIPLAAGTDAPFGNADPWRSMANAVSRQTATGQILGQEEALTPEQSFNLYTGSLTQPQTPQTLQVGSIADICLLNRPWAYLQNNFTCAPVSLTFSRGNIIYDRQGDNASTPH